LDNVGSHYIRKITTTKKLIECDMSEVCVTAVCIREREQHAEKHIIVMSSSREHLQLCI